jgi:hypothetical protein
MDTNQEKQAAHGAPRQARVRQAPVRRSQAYSRERIRELLGWNMLLPDSMARRYPTAD